MTLTVSVSNPKKNEDKMVILLLEVLNEEEVVARESVAIKAEDDGIGHSKTAKWTLPAALLQPSTKLRITMNAVNY